MSLQALDLVCIRGDRELFAGIAFALAPGEALRVAGRNGSGKSSLLRMLCGLTEPASGEVRWDGRPIRRMREEFHAKLIYVGHASGIKDELLGWENLAIAATLGGAGIGVDAACEVLQRLGLGPAAELPARALSQGQRKRLGLARLWLDLPQPLWVLDEPFTALDADAVQALCAAIDRHLARGGMLVYATHQEVALDACRHLRLELGDGGAC
jgi:heme exporter protein A